MVTVHCCCLRCIDIGRARSAHRCMQRRGHPASAHSRTPVGTIWSIRLHSSLSLGVRFCLCLCFLLVFFFCFRLTPRRRHTEQKRTGKEREKERKEKSKRKCRPRGGCMRCTCAPACLNTAAPPRLRAALSGQRWRERCYSASCHSVVSRAASEMRATAGEHAIQVALMSGSVDVLSCCMCPPPSFLSHQESPESPPQPQQSAANLK